MPDTTTLDPRDHAPATPISAAVPESEPGPGAAVPRGILALGSRRLARLPGLAGFLPEATGFRSVPFAPGPVAAIAGWGLKRHGRRARGWARLRGVPYLALEDGFLRSRGLGVKGAPPLSLVVDDLGIYYDASAPSRLEALLESGAGETPSLAARAASGLARFRAEAASKYNSGSPPSSGLARRLGEGFVLVADQTRGDASIGLGQADAASFTAMLDAAIRENPGAVVAVKLHPDVLAGHREGHLEAAQGPNVVLVDEPVDPAWAIAAAARVYTVTSGLGLEAVLAGKPVRTFGLPCYAGWGLTEDTLACPRRTRRATLEGLFAACFLLYPRYLDPFRLVPARFEDTLDLLAEFRARAAETARTTVALGFSRWKQDAVRPFLAWGGGTLVFAASTDEALALARSSAAPVVAAPAPPVAEARTPQGARPRATPDPADLSQPPAVAAAAAPPRIVVWASRCPDDLAPRAAQARIPVERMEDGFLRSVGLGARLIQPLSLALDPSGIYYDPQSGSRLEALLQAGGFPDALLERARALVASIAAARVTKYNVGAKLRLEFPAGRARILVPGQVEDDASIRLGTRLVRSNLALLEAVRSTAPDAFLVWKPHPDVTAGFRAGRVPDEAVRRLADASAADIAMPDLLDAVDAVHTMTSLTGFEALLRGRAVTCWGRPFYAGWGLTEDRDPIPHRTRRIGLDELVAAALILHPRYFDPVTALPCGPEIAVLRLSDPTLWRPTPTQRLRQTLARLNKAIRPPR